MSQRNQIIKAIGELLPHIDDEVYANICEMLFKCNECVPDNILMLEDNDSKKICMNSIRKSSVKILPTSQLETILNYMFEQFRDIANEDESDESEEEECEDEDEEECEEEEDN